MILPFSTELNGKPTYFVEKIHKGLRDYKHNFYGLDPSVHYPPNYNFIIKDRCSSKIHTIRKDEKNRWKPGMMIDFFINSRTKDAFRFAPRVQVVSTQDIEIRHQEACIEVFIDGDWFGEVFLNGLEDIESWTEDVELLAIRDGFDSLEDFFDYFDGNFTGKIIHWTDLKY